MVDSLIIKACKQKDRKAFKQCYEVCAPYVYAIIKNYVSGTDDRKDAMQEVFAQVFHSIGKFDSNKASFKTWLSKITVNQTINFIKKNKKLSHLVPLNNEHEFIEEIKELDMEKINNKVLQKTIELMPTGYRTIFLLSHIEGYSHDEIAQILNISNQTSRSQLSRAIKWLSGHYKEQLKLMNYG